VESPRNPGWFKPRIGQPDDGQVPHAEVALIVAGEQVRAAEDEDLSVRHGPGEAPGFRHPGKLLGDRKLQLDILLQTAHNIHYFREASPSNISQVEAYFRVLLPEV
jgi:hypothetical protein